jgi:hypothetical protein
VKKIIVAKSRDMKTRSNLAESSKEGYGSKSAVWQFSFYSYCARYFKTLLYMIL